jgi:hypothetical protein
VSYDGMYRLYTAEEERAQAAFDEARARTDALLADLIARVSGSEPAADLEAAITDREGELLRLVHARLTRCLPHLADVIALCLWPEFVPLPEWVAPGGLPEPATVPANAHLRHYRHTAAMIDAGRRSQPREGAR